MFVCLNDLVDTLKLQYYASDVEKEKLSFNTYVEYFQNLKTEAQNIKSEDSQSRYKTTSLDGLIFRVMATSQRGFHVVLQNGDFTLSLRKMDDKNQNPIIKAEFRAEFLLRNGYKTAIKTVNNIVELMLKNYFIKVSEIHLAKDIQNYNFNILDFYRLKTLKRNKQIFNQDTNLFYSGLKFTGFSIGKGDEMLRIYNKTFEIDKNKEKAFVQYLSWDINPDYDNSKTVWRIEFQLRRKKLKELFSSWGVVENLQSLLRSISSIWDYLINTFVLKEMTIKECQEIQSGYKIKDDEITILTFEAIKKRFQRANVHKLWDFIKYFKGNTVEKLQKIKDVCKPSVQYVKNAFKSVLSTFIKLKRGDFNKDELIDILIQADKELQSKKKLTLLQNARLKTVEYCSRAKDFYNHTGIDVIQFNNYEQELRKNLKDTFQYIEITKNLKKSEIIKKVA
jgi:hypothetical protein